MKPGWPEVVSRKLGIVAIPVLVVSAAAGLRAGDAPRQVAVAIAADQSGVFLPALLRSADFSAGAPPTPVPTQALPTSSPSPSPSPTAAPLGRLLLNEVSVAPAKDQSPWIEIRNTGPGPASPAGVTLTNALTQTYKLPGALAPVPANGLLLVVFDGQDRIEGATVHADRTDFVQATGDALVLTSTSGARLDRVAWGPHQAETTPLGPGGFVPALVTGATIGRYPGADGPRATEWVRYVKDDATPGMPNPVPPPEAFPMVDGLVTDQAVVELEWYAVRGASSYRVQLAVDQTFSPLIADSTVTSAMFTSPALQPSSYLWRVQAIGSHGAVSRFSAALHLEVVSGSPLPLDTDGRASSPSRPAKKALLGVPMIKQHKDTQMLLLEEPNDKGPHAWDVAHPDLDKSDPADNANCGLATTAMVNAFYGGDMTQDRLGYELFKDTRPGPEDDLNYGRGISDDQFIQLLQFALGGGVTAYGWLGDPGERNAFWESVTLAIDDGRPVPMCGGGHCVVITGYSDNLLGRRLAINDPWAGPRVVNADFVPVSVYAFPPSSPAVRYDESAVQTDSDGDGIVDFDENHRFGTDPENSDSDQDKLPDKTDVYLSVFDEDHGHVNWGNARDDIDGDGLPPERDDDADNGGCLDGLEDLNQDGRTDKAAQETSPYEKDDDKCISGWWHLKGDVTTQLEDGTSRSWEEEWAHFSLRPVSAGKLEGHSRHSYYAGAHDEYSSGPCPVLDEPTAGVDWSSDLTGSWTGQDVVVNAAVKSPPWTVTAISCGIVVKRQTDGAAWGGTGGTLKDGVFDLHADFPIGPGSGYSFIDVHIEQSKDAAPLP
jgi:hypothetical protein